MKKSFLFIGLLCFICISTFAQEASTANTFYNAIVSNGLSAESIFIEAPQDSIVLTEEFDVEGIRILQDDLYLITGGIFYPERDTVDGYGSTYNSNFSWDIVSGNPDSQYRSDDFGENVRPLFDLVDASRDPWGTVLNWLRRCAGAD